MKASYRIGWLLARGILVLLGARWSGADRLPRTGGLVVAPNHRSYLDPPLVGCGAGRELSFFAKRELFGVPVLGFLIGRVFNSIPIRRGEADRRAIAAALGAVTRGFGLVLFPEGTRAAPDGFLEPKMGVAMVALKAGVPVVPVYIEGTGRGVRGLVRSMVRLERIHVRFGEPIDLAARVEARGAEGYRRGTELVMEAIRALRDEGRESIRRTDSTKR